MARPFLLVQLSDPHIGADWAAPDPVRGLARAVAAVRAMPARPDAVLVSGDLADHASDAEYEQVLDLLSPLAVPLYVLPGNHDDRAALRRHFDIPGAGGDPIRYSADLGAMRLIALDTTIPGEDGGALGAGQLEWLDAELAAAPTLPTLLAMHHPPLVSGIPACDEVGLLPGDRRALENVMARHEQVEALVGGHMHRSITSRLARRPVVTSPSTYVQTRLAFDGDGVDLEDDDSTGFLVHALVDGALVSHVEPVL